MADPDGKRTNGGGFLAFWSTLPGVLTGVAAVLTAVIGLVGLWRSFDDGTDAPTRPEVAPATTSATTSATTTDASDPPEAGVLAEGRLTMDADAGIANLKRKRVSSSDADADLWLNAPGNPDSATLYSPYGGLLSRADGASDKPACVAALTARAQDTIPFVDLPAGSTVCLRTGSGAIAAIRLLSVPEIGSPRLVLEYTLWA
jgi:hypothetical protein